MFISKIICTSPREAKSINAHILIWFILYFGVELMKHELAWHFRQKKSLYLSSISSKVKIGCGAKSSRIYGNKSNN